MLLEARVEKGRPHRLKTPLEGQLHFLLTHGVELFPRPLLLEKPQTLHAFAPVISPSVSLAILGYRDRLHFGLRFGCAVLSPEKGARLLRLFIARLRSIA